MGSEDLGRSQTAVAGSRAERVAGKVAASTAAVSLLAAGRSSQAWKIADDAGNWVVRVPIPQSGRSISYRSESLIGDLLADAGHPVTRWRIEIVDDLECSVGMMLPGSPTQYATDWSSSFVSRFAALLRDLHRLPTAGWGPLEDRSDRLQGCSLTANDGIVARWSHASIWPFDGTALDAHPLAEIEPELATAIAPQRGAILAAAQEPFGLLHSDLHREHLLQQGNELTGVLDFGDAFIGSTAWDFALIHWYYGAGNARRVAQSYGAEAELSDRAALLALAVGCYKVAKAPLDPTPRTRLRRLLP